MKGLPHLTLWLVSLLLESLVSCGGLCEGCAGLHKDGTVFGYILWKWTVYACCAGPSDSSKKVRE